ncbi:galactose-binding like protein [Podospora conica]|nr:galactose-binding like protein [Schizothecium conicum]
MITTFSLPAKTWTRRALGELNPNRDLNTPRGLSKRRPIAFDKENEFAVLRGIRLGTYNQEEVRIFTDMPVSGPAASIGQILDSEEEDLSLPLDDTFAGGAASEVEEPVDDDEGDNLDEAEMEAEYGESDDEMLGEVMDEELTGEHGDGDLADDDEQLLGPPFDPTAVGLKEINNLAHFGVSSHKPGNGVEEMLSDDLDKFWQSDGQQPHLVTIHFVRRVEIRAIRFYVDYKNDESYTPTNIVFYAGTGPHDLIQFAEVPLTNPVGWQDVPIANSGGGPDGHSLCAWIVQMHIKENHQNGKDTHIRGIKIFALDESATSGVAVSDTLPEMDARVSGNTRVRRSVPGTPSHEDNLLQETLDAFDVGYSRFGRGEGGASSPLDFMHEPQLR